MFLDLNNFIRKLLGLVLRCRVKLVMTLLVRDEVDIIEKNIKFHLKNGVDHIVAIDNGSVDGTIDVLEKYVKMGVLSYEVENSHTYEQDKWVSRMTKKAVRGLGATHVINCDADEFWTSSYSDLKRSVAENYFSDVIKVSVRNFLPPTNIYQVGFRLNNFRYYVAKTVLCPGEIENRVSGDLLRYEYPEKIITSRKITSIGYGNDSVNSTTPIKEVKSRSVYIRHYPIRSYSQFKRKVINGGSSYEKNPVKNASIGWHWKAWYRTYKEGKLLNEYDKLSLVSQRRILIRQGVIKKNYEIL